MPDPLFTDLLRDTERLAWQSAGEVRERGRRRTRRTRLVAGLATFVAVAAVTGGAVAFTGRPDAAPPPIPPATGSPAPSVTSPAPPPVTEPVPPSAPPARRSSSSAGPPVAVPDAAMLRAADLPAGFRFDGSDLDGDWSLEAVTIFCQEQAPTITPGEVARRGAVFRSGTGPNSTSMIQRVTRHSAGNAALAMRRVRELLTTCEPANGANASLSLLATGLGGSESVLAGSDVEGHQSWWLLVRQDDLVSQLWLPDGITPAGARQYAERIAERLGS